MLALLAVCAMLSDARASSIELRHGSLTIQGTERTFYYYVPPDLIGQENYPLVIVLHSAKSTGRKVAENWGFLEVARKEGFVVLFPNGWYGEWNDGRNAPFRYKFFKKRKDDVAFLSQLIHEFVVEYKANPARVYLTGASNGGMMALRAACEISMQLTAVAPLLASLPRNLRANCIPGRALPIMMINGTADETTPMGGGPVIVDDEAYGEVIPVQETVDIWVQSNICSQSPSYGRRDEYRAARRVKGINTESYLDCNTGKVVLLYLLEDGGHFIPSFKRRKMTTEYEKEAGNFNAAQEIWDFFRQY